jgi:hypothetical protein
MAFGVGSDEDQSGFDNWFPDDIKPSKIEVLFFKLNQAKLLAKPKFGFYIDMGGEFYIYEGDPEDNVVMNKNIYEGNIHQFIHELMEYFNVRDDT